MIRVADYILKRINEEGVNHVFYVPGGQCVYLMDALRRNENIVPVAMHHEQSAAMAALTYSLVDENFGACIVTTGCAGTNTMTGLLHAWQDSIPCIFVSGQQNYELTTKASGLNLRQVGVQEADIETIVKPLTKYAVTVEKAEDIAYHLEKAITLAKTGRPGPVWIDVPLNVQNSMINENTITTYMPDEEKNEVSKEDIEYVLKELESANRPIILAGQGVRLAKAAEEFNALIHKMEIPAVFSRNSYDIMNYEDRLNVGVVSGAAGPSRYANFAVQNSDLLICIGSRVAVEVTGGDRKSFARAAKKIVVDIDPVEHTKDGITIDKFIHADAKNFLDELNNYTLSKKFDEWVDKCNHWKEILPQYDYVEVEEGLLDAKKVMRSIGKKLPAKSVIVSDAGFTGAATPSQMEIKDGQRIVHSFAQGEMGFSLPGACGAAALVDAPVVAFTGDGSLMMNLQEFQTVVRNNYNIKIVIINNNGYSGVRHGQRAHFRGKTIGTDASNGLTLPDYGKIAEAFGIKYLKVDGNSDIDLGIDEMLCSEGPFIFEAMCDPNQFDLHNALVSYGKRKYGFRPIEDQSPFIPREVFFEEMVIEPLETSYGIPV